MGLWSVNKTAGCFDQRIKKLYSVNVCMMAPLSLMSVQFFNSACVKSLEFADIRFNFLVPLV